MINRLKSSHSDTFKPGNGESTTKVADTSSEGENSANEKFISEKTNHFQFYGVRFTPNVLEFVDAFEGKQFVDKITLQNVGRNPVVLRIGEPTSFVFQLKKPSRRPVFLASGASLSRTITYTYHSDDLVQKSRIPILINGNQIDYPIVVKKAVPELEVKPPKIDFGIINLGSEVKTLVLTLYNFGGTRTKYEIDVGKNDLDLVVNPLKGTIKAKHEVKVTVELMGMKEGEFYREIWIKTNETPIRVPVLVEVVRPRLLIVFPNGTEELSAIDFPPTFVGTQKAVPFVLKNRGGETALFITVGEVNGEYQFLNKARKTHHIFNFFRLTAEEGRLEPHESRVLTALFQPETIRKTKGWHHQENLEKKPQKEHVVFFTLSQVHCIERKEIERACSTFEQVEKKKSSSNLVVESESSNLFESLERESSHPELTDDYNVKESGFRLCLRGTSVKPEMIFQPSKFYFGEINIGQTEQKVLTITNKNVIRVKCVVLKKMNVNIVPDQLWIEPEKVYELSVKVTPSSAGVFHHSVKVQLLAESDVVYSTDEPFKKIAEYTLGVFFTGLIKPKILAPKIGLGITPLITDEVGVNKELVTFSNLDKVPYAAKLLSQTEEFRPVWMHSTEAKDTLIALPNDRSRRFQDWPKDKLCRTIFKGWLRYAPPKDTLYTLSSQELIAKNQNNAIWADYFLMLREIRKAYNEENAECKEILSSCYNKKFKEHLKTKECMEVTPRLKKRIPGFDLQNCLVPLSPMYLSYVVVEPKMINFGMVAVKNRMSANLRIYNLNVFPIAIKFIPGNNAVTLNEGTVIVHSDSEKTIKIWFELGILGRYYGFLNYVINGSHEFKITISAFVIARTVLVEPKTLVFSNYPVHLAFQPQSLFLTMENQLQTPISYKLLFSQDSPYFSPLEEGVVPPKTKLLSEIVIGLNPKKPLTAELNFVSESNEKELLKINQCYRKLSVKFLNNRIDLKDIPLNLKTKVTPIVENECFHSVTFEVIDGSPMPGVTVEPRLGIIKARSFFPFDVLIQIPVAMQFSFEIPLIIQTSNKITVRITGNVVLPNIRINPAVINMRKICALSFDTAMICIENAGTTRSEIEIDFRACPEYKVLDGNSKFNLNPKQTTSVILMFEPKDAARFVFYLPIIINNILGPPMMQEIETESVYFFINKLGKMYEIYGEVRDTEKSGEKVPLAIINCTVACSLITVTPPTVIFQRETTNAKSDKTLEQLNDSYSNFEFPSKEIVITNSGTTDVTFCLRNDDLGKSNDSPFDLQPVDPENVEFRLKSMKATLQPGKELIFIATFYPKKPGEYTIQVPVYVRGYNNGVVYCYITLSGQLSHPKLIPEAEEIHFYPVPLNVSTELTFTITAENYHKPATINCIICEQTEKKSSDTENLTITWLETPEVTQLNGVQTFPVHISFRSVMPVVLRCYLVFVDSQNDYCSVLVTAVADNSSVTLYSFLNFYTSRYKIMRQECLQLIWKADEHSVLPYPFEKGNLTKNEKSETKSYDLDVFMGATEFWLSIDRGPVIIVQGALTMFNVSLVTKKNVTEDSLTALLPDYTNLSPGASLPLTAKSAQSSKVNFEKIDITYPAYPHQESLYKVHCDKILQYVERWIFEVVMKCDQYFMIPTSFRVFRNSTNTAKTKTRKQKDVIDFMSEIFGRGVINSLYEIEDTNDFKRWVVQLHNFYSSLLEFLKLQKCFVPHVRVEYFFSYDEYSFYVQNIRNSDLLRPLKEELQTNSSGKLNKNPSQWKKSDTDDTYVQKTNSAFSNKDWFSTKSIIDGFSSSDAYGLDKDDNVAIGDKSGVEINSKLEEDKEEVREEYVHAYEVLDESEFSRRSTQAWFDIVLQIFRNKVLKKVVYKNTMPEVQVIELEDKVPVMEVQRSEVFLYGEEKEPMMDNNINNLYNIQERTLLLWLNYHLNVQRKQMWRSISESSIPGDKIINNFQNDLCDSLAFISVTASYCPFIIPDFFRDCFPIPDTPNKVYHNAGRLVQAWRELNIGLTVETMDIVKPNNVFMVMLVAQLYDVLPAMHPRYLVCFEASLSSYQSKKFSVHSLSGNLVLQPKLLGEDGKFFKLSNTSLLELKKGRTQELKLTFYARKIKKIKATLLLSGCQESPYFGKTVAFFLEGQLTDLAEFEKLSFSAPLYKVICTEIPCKSPYSEPATYEVWYSTTKPILSENSDLIAHSKPWSKIWSRKVCRRLFLNRNEVNYNPEQKILLLNVTIACFTRKDRFFWLLFRSKTGDFIIRIKIKTKSAKGFWTVTSCPYPDTWPLCLCPKRGKEIRVNWADLKTCPLITIIRLPARNDELWNALKTMFLKSVLPQEKGFWTEYFEKDIGLCIIRWLLNSDEEEEVIDEFIPLLKTEITYKLNVIQPKSNLQMPPQIEIKDVRQETDITIPIHLAQKSEIQIEVEMVSESLMETRKFAVKVKSLNVLGKEEDGENSVIMSGACQPCKTGQLESSPCDAGKHSKKFPKLQ